MLEEKIEIRPKNKNVAYTLILSFIIFFFVTGYSIRLIDYISMTLLLVISFFVMFSIFLAIAYFLRKYITKHLLVMLEFIYLSFGVLGLFGIYSLESEWSFNKAKSMTPRINMIYESIQSRIDFGINYYSGWDRNLDMFGYKAGNLSDWFTDTKKIVSQKYNKESWVKFISINKKNFIKPQSEVNFILDWMQDYIEESENQKALYAKSDDGNFSIYKYFSFWALAFSLAIRLTKTTIEFKQWTSK